MTEREFDRLRGYQRNSYNHFEREEEPQDGYFAFFKLRCLICLVLFLGLVAVDKQLNIKENDKVKQVMQILNQEEISVEECFQIIK